jgi:Na+/H+ antiporter NhaD/arsenite permease-like protein
MTLSTTAMSALAIFAATYLVVAIGRVPGLRLDRAGAALVGASLMVACGALTLSEAYRAIDFDTLTLLLGMMLLVANLRLSGAFGLINAQIAARVQRPFGLLCAVTLLSGGLSAFLVNDMICLVLTPLVLELTLQLRRNPVPYLLAVALASNIGSVATMTGNPQNIIAGSLSGLSYTAFFCALAPVAVIGLALTIALVALGYRDEFGMNQRLCSYAVPLRYNRALVLKSGLVTIALVVALFVGVQPARAALLAGALLLLTRRVKAHKVYEEIDGPLLILFAGLFVVVGGLEKAVLGPQMFAAAGAWHLERLPVLAGVTAVLSNLVSNVPAVLVLKPFVQALPDSGRAWLAVAMASTLAGNFTVLGSVANLIVVQRARARRIDIGFWTYFRVGAPLTVLTLLLGTAWLAWLN